MKFAGVHVAHITPFDASGALDGSALKRLVSSLAATGVRGLVACGSTGEAPTLSFSEWSEVVQLSTEIAKLNNKVAIAGCGDNSTDSAKRKILQAKEIGSDAALVVNPYYNKPTSEGILSHYFTLADLGLPIILYNVPSRTGVNLSVEIVTRLLGHPNIIGIKDATTDYSRWAHIAEQVDLNQKALFAGEDDCFVGVLSVGGSGIISAAANLIPESFIAMYESFTSGNSSKAFELQKRARTIIQACFLETNPAPIKAALSILGRCENVLRQPLVPVTDTTHREIASRLKQLGAF